MQDKFGLSSQDRELHVANDERRTYFLVCLFFCCLFLKISFNSNFDGDFDVFGVQGVHRCAVL